MLFIQIFLCWNCFSTNFISHCNNYIFIGLLGVSSHILVLDSINYDCLLFIQYIDISVLDQLLSSWSSNQRCAIIVTSLHNYLVNSDNHIFNIAFICHNAIGNSYLLYISLFTKDIQDYNGLHNGLRYIKIRQNSKERYLCCKEDIRTWHVRILLFNS